METITMLLTVLFVFAVENQFDATIIEIVKMISPVKLVALIENNKYFQKAVSTVDLYSVVTMLVALVVVL